MAFTLSPLFLVSSLIFISLSIQRVLGSCAKQDQQALLGFKAGITSWDQGGALSSWLPSTDCCTWKGVTCDAQAKRVIQLDVSNGGLVGKISPSLGKLSRLQILTLSNNQFSGRLPPKLGDLSELQELYTDSNPKLGGTIPASFGRLKKLRELDVSGCDMSGSLPESIGGMSSLEHIRIYSNRISGPIPNSFGHLSNLFNADLAYNPISGPIPDSFTANLTNLFFLFLDHTNITGLPRDLTNLKSLQIVYLSGNPLLLSTAGANAIEGLATLPGPGEIHLSGIGLTGPIPHWIANLPKLQDNSDEVNPLIDLSFNELSGSIPSEIAKVENLERLILNHNQLSGKIPKELGNATTLQYLDLSENKLLGMIPKSFTQLPSLRLFNVSFNNLRGEIPQVEPFLSFPVSSYMANPGLCGRPVKPCK